MTAASSRPDGRSGAISIIKDGLNKNSTRNMFHNEYEDDTYYDEDDDHRQDIAKRLTFEDTISKSDDDT